MPCHVAETQQLLEQGRQEESVAFADSQAHAVLATSHVYHLQATHMHIYKIIGAESMLPHGTEREESARACGEREHVGAAHGLVGANISPAALCVW